MYAVFLKWGDFIKLKILKSFYDKYSNELYSVGDVIDFKIDRAKDLLNNQQKIVDCVDEISDKSPKKTTRRKIKNE